MTSRRLLAAWCVAAVGAGAALLAITLLMGGGAPPPAPPGLPDDGRLAAWAGDVVGYLSLVVGVAAVGFGLLASGLLDQVRPQMRSIAAAITIAWAAITVLQLGVLAQELQGVALFDSDRAVALVIQLALTVVAAGIWSLDLDRIATTAGLVVATAAMLPVALAGHPRSASQPWVAGISLSIHIVSASIWIGGLLAFGWIAVTESDEWHLALRKYSRLAVDCVVALAVSGTAAALVRIDSPAQLFNSRYGAVITFKVVCLGALVAAGFLQRRHVVVSEQRRRAAFVTIAGFELTVMVLTLALASALSHTPPPA